MTASYVSSLGLLASQYDGFILDLWGVIHDGQNPYPGAKECLGNLRAEQKKIVLLSNAPRRASHVVEVMRRMGIGDGLYDALVTSGEAAYECLADQQSSFFRAAGDNYIYIGLEKDRNILKGLPYREIDSPEKAHFLLLSHSYYDNQPYEELCPLLKRCLSAKLPALCINPDREVVRQSGEYVACAGAIAARYTAGGGQVIYFGKPHSRVYDISLKLLEDISPLRILAIGDNLATDITGARNKGLASALVTGGILRRNVGEPGTETYITLCNRLFSETGAEPNYLMPAFTW